VTDLSQSRFRKLRQFRNTCRDLARFVFRHEFSGRASARLHLEVDIGHAEMIGVMDDGGDSAIFLDRGDARVSRVASGVFSSAERSFYAF
jgi:hypothetical protein